MTIAAADQTAEATPASTAPAVDPEVVLADAERQLGSRLEALSRWDAERWAAGQERLLPPVPARALHAAIMQAAIETERSDQLDAAFRRVERKVAKLDWADRRPFEGELKEAVGETAAAVIALAKHALAARALADVAHKLSPPRRLQLQAADERVFSG